MTNIWIIQGHPDFGGNHLCHHLAAAYGEGAKMAGHIVSEIDIGGLEIDFVRNTKDMELPPSAQIMAAQRSMLEAEHLMIIFPLWLGTMPALVKAFFEQIACGEFLLGKSDKGWPIGKLKGRSARVVVTMGMPAAAYKLLFGAYGVRGFESSILSIAGVAPIRETLFGNVEGKQETRTKWLKKMEDLGARAR